MDVGGSMSYDPPMCKKVLFLKERIGFEELIERIYSIMTLDRNRYKVNLVFRNCVGLGVFAGMPLEDDNGIDIIYYMKSNSPPQASEIYVEVVELAQSNAQLGQNASMYSTSDPHRGPCTPDLLYLSPQHRARAVFYGTNHVLHVKRCDGFFWVYQHAIDPRVLQYVDAAGFGGLRRAGTFRVDHGLVTALIERWRQETHTFHLPMGEATITLQDVEVLWGLRVDGLPVTLVHRTMSKQQRKELVHELLGFWPDDSCFKDGRLKMTSFFELLATPLPKDASDEQVRQHARMYILILLGGQLFADTCGNVINLNWLDRVRNLEAMESYSWGSAVLACLYSRMCHASYASCKATAGPYMLLQMWAWERLPTICPTIVVPVSPGDYPRGRRWTTKCTEANAPQHVLSYYRDQLSNLRLDQFIWEPYSEHVLSSLPQYCTAGRHIWRAKVPLIFWHIVEFHCPERVMRQFGMHQSIPDNTDTDIGKLHHWSLAGFTGRDWAAFHSDWVKCWNARVTAVVNGQPVNTYLPTPEYMAWYREHTVLYITTSVHSQMGDVTTCHRPIYDDSSETIALADRDDATDGDALDGDAFDDGMQPVQLQQCRRRKKPKRFYCSTTPHRKSNRHMHP